MAALSQIGDLQAQIQEALRRGDTAEVLRLQAMLGKPEAIQAAVPPMASPGPAQPPTASAPTQPAPNITQKDLDAATDDDGKVNWWKLLTKTLAVPVATTAIGAMAGGEKGARLGLQAGASALKGYQEGTEIAEKSNERQATRKLSEMKLLKDAGDDKATRRSRAITLYKETGAQGPDLDPADKKAYDDRKRTEAEDKLAEDATKAARTTEGGLDKEARSETSKIEAEKRAEQRQVEREARAEERRAKQEAGKGLSNTDITAAIKDLEAEQTEIKDRGTYPLDAKGRQTYEGTPTYTPDDQARLYEIQQERQVLRGQRKGILKVLGGAGKGQAEPEPTPAEIDTRAQKWVREGRINPETGAKFSTAAEARTYILAQIQKQKGTNVVP